MIQTNLHFLRLRAFDPTRLDAQWLTIAALAVLVFLCLALRGRLPDLSRRIAHRLAGRPRRKSRPADDPFHAVSRIAFEPMPVLPQEEALLLPLLESATRTVGRGHRVLARTSLAELIRPAVTSGTLAERRAATAAIANKRLDFAIIDRSGRLVAAVAYNGTAHYLSDTFDDDALKREVVRQAGLLYVEVQQGFDDAEVLDRICALLAPDPDPSGKRASAHVVRVRNRGIA